MLPTPRPSSDDDSMVVVAEAVAAAIGGSVPFRDWLRSDREGCSKNLVKQTHSAGAIDLAAVSAWRDE